MDNMTTDGANTDAETRAPVGGKDKFTTQGEAMDRAEQLGCEGTHSMNENGETIYMPCNTHAAYDAIVNADDSAPGYRAPAPLEDQIEGSDTNEPGSAKGKTGDIKLDEATETGLQRKSDEHNTAMEDDDRPSWTRVRVGALRSVYRRGAGAFSGSHRPGIGRQQWSMARVNAFLFLARTGAPANPKYVGDNDLLNPEHPKYSEAERASEQRIITDVPQYIRTAAEKGLAYHAEGKSGDGLQPRTVREARELAEGRAQEDKVLRLRAWIARHRGDWEGNPDNSDPQSEGFPGAGAVAAYLWGVDPTRPGAADRVSEWATGILNALESNATQATALTQRKESIMAIEYRATSGAMEATEDGLTYTGYIALFDEPSSPALGFTEIIKRGAFSKSVAAAERGEWEVKAYQDHNPSLFLGTTKTGTLTLQEDERGLKAQVQLNPDVTYAADLAANLKRDGASFGASFGFTIPAKGDAWSADGTTRELLNCRLVECSILTGMQPAYPSTVGLGAVRALAERMDTEPSTLRDAIDSLMNGTTDVDNLRLLRAIIEKAHGAIAGTEPEPEPDESAAQAEGEVPQSIRELQLRLMRAKR